MSKKTVFILHLLVKRHQRGAMLHTILLIGVEQTANSRGQAFDGFGGILAGCLNLRRRINWLASEQHRPKQRSRFRLIRTTPEALPGARDYIVSGKAENLLGAGQGVFILAEFGSVAAIQDRK